MTSGATMNGSSSSSPAEEISVLITGAAGFIGSHLCERLLEEGHRVWGLDNFDNFYDPSRKRRNLSDALDHPSMHLVEGDIRDRVLLDGLMSDLDFNVVVHLAARPGIQASLEAPFRTYETNLTGTLTLVEAMRRHSVPALLFASSASVYGNSAKSSRREDASADRPLSPYAASKRAGEMLCHVYHHRHGLTVHCLRLSSVFGPRQRPDIELQEFTRLLAKGRPLDLNGETPGSQDYTWVSDVVDGIVLSLKRARSRSGHTSEYQVINIGSGEAVDRQELVRKLSDAMEISTASKDPTSDTSEAVKTAVSSIEKARELLGYRPSVSLEDGLAQLSRGVNNSPR